MPIILGPIWAHLVATAPLWKHHLVNGDIYATVLYELDVHNCLKWCCKTMNKTEA